MKFSQFGKGAPPRPEAEPRLPEPGAPAAEAPPETPSVPNLERAKPAEATPAQEPSKTVPRYADLIRAKFPSLARKAEPRPLAAPAGSPRQAARAAYGRAVGVVKGLLQDLPQGRAASQESALAAVSECLALLRAGNQAIVAMTAHSTASNYLYAHSANVSILSMHVGLGLGLEPGMLQRLGLAALLEDLGMARYLGLAAEARPLSASEQEEVRMHPVESLRLLPFIKDIEEATKATLTELIAAKVPGAPKPTAPETATAAQIIALCEIYEATSHHRAWREPLLPHAAVKRIIKEQAGDFDRRLIQKFVERLSLFPPGSFVELSSGEIACVVETHPKTPTLPTVELRLRADQSPAPPTLVNLADNPLTHIKRAVDETRLPLKDKKTLLAFQAARWWVE